MGIHELYEKGHINGWVGYDAVQKYLSENPYLEYKNIIRGQARSAVGKKRMLYDIVRKVLGKDTDNYAQEIGDCTSFGDKNALEYNTCTGILLRGQKEKFRPVYPPWIYGAGRVWVAQGMFGGADGCSGAAVKDACMQYGVLFADEDGVPKYSGSVAHQWGASGPPSQFKDIGIKYKLVSAAKIDNWDDAVNAVADTGAPVTIASNQGFSYKCDAQGFMAAQGVWGHQMCLIGVDNSYKTPYGIILNSWGNLFEIMKDFDTGDTLPIGVLRVRAEVIDSMLKAGDSWAFSEFDGFPDLSDKIDKSLFDLGGD